MSVLTDMELMQAARGAIARTFTKSGHLSQRVGHEHLGVCGVHGCSPLCVEQVALFGAIDRWLIEHGESQTEPAATAAHDAAQPARVEG